MVDTKTKNETILQTIREKLGSLQAYIPTAKHFAKWLGDERAYYPEARPKIVETLLVAEATLQRDSGTLTPDIRAKCCEAFLVIVSTMRQFAPLFEEKDLKDRLDYIFSTVPHWQQFAPPPAYTSNPGTPLSATFPSTPIPAAQPGAQLPPAAPVPDAGTNTFATASPQPPANVPARGGDSEPSVADVSKPTETTDPVPAKIVRKTKAKRKRTELDLEKLLEADTQRYKQQRTAQQIAEASIPSPIIQPVVDSPVASTPPARGTEDDPIIVTRAEPSAVETANVENDDIVLAPVHDDPMLDIEPNIPSPLAPEKEAQIDRVYRQLAVPPALEQALVADGPLVAPPETQVMPDETIASEDTAEPTSLVLNPGRIEPVHSPEAVVAELAPVNDVDMHPPPTTVELRPDIPTVEQDSELRFSGEEVDSVALMQDFMKNIVVQVNERITVNSKDSGQETKPIVDDRPANEVESSCATGIAANAIIARHRGTAEGPFTLNFSINEDQLRALSLWNARWNHNDVEHSLCISLMCFRESDIKDKSDSYKKVGLVSLLRDLECSWPNSGDLTMTTSWNGQQTKLPMAPLVHVPNEPAVVDVSPFLSLGSNTLTFTQTTNLAGYCFVLCAHHPSPSQLRAVQRRRSKVETWSGWLNALRRPVEIPFQLPEASIS